MNRRVHQAAPEGGFVVPVLLVHRAGQHVALQHLPVIGQAREQSRRRVRRSDARAASWSLPRARYGLVVGTTKPFVSRAPR